MVAGTYLTHGFILGRCDTRRAKSNDWVRVCRKLTEKKMKTRSRKYSEQIHRQYPGCRFTMGSPWVHSVVVGRMQQIILKLNCCVLDPRWRTILPPKHILSKKDLFNVAGSR